MKLSNLGWSSFHKSENLDLSTVARITAVYRSHLRASTAEKEINIHLPGSIDQMPVVGDWITTTPEFEDEQGQPAALLKELLPRKSFLSRMTNTGEQAMAANVDTVFVVTSANQDFNMNRLHRYLLLIRKGEAEPVVLISKTDLLDSAQELIQQVTEKLEVRVIGSSIVNNTGIEDILQLMPEGSTSVFVGSSGVGKSSLVNKLLGEDIQATKDIREDDQKGRHTTTGRQMFEVSGYGLIIDTPGIREVQVFGDQEDVDETFPKIALLISQCKFSDCQHNNEPNCAVRKALENGELEDKEWESYLKLQKEVAFVKRKTDKVEMANAKKHWKEISLKVRNLKK